MTWVEIFHIFVQFIIVVQILLACLAKEDVKEVKHVAWAILLTVSLVADGVLFQ